MQKKVEKMPSFALPSVNAKAASDAKNASDAAMHF